MELTPEELLRQYNIEYKDRSENIVCKCLHPNHNDNNPSMSIRKSDGLFKCFSCGFTGNYYTLYKAVTGKYLTTDGENRDTREWNSNIIKPKRKPIIPEIAVIGKLYSPLENNKIREFLRSVGVYNDSFIEKYNISYSVYTEMIAKHLIGRKDVKYTKMYNRICTPIQIKNKIANIEGRVFDNLSTLPEGTPKVLYVKGGSVETLYNWENIDKSQPVVTTESIKNFWKIWNVYPNTVAFFHAIPTKKQLELLEEVSVLIHFGDNDEGFFGKKSEDNSKGKLPERKGTLQILSEQYSKDFKICWDKRVHSNGKGYDANDCSLEEIENHISKAIWYSDYISKPKFKVVSNWA